MGDSNEMPILFVKYAPGSSERAAKHKMKVQPKNANEQLSGAISGIRKKTPGES